MKPVVRLLGEDAQVRAVGREAVQALQRSAGASDLFAEARDLHRRRRQQLAARAARAVTPADHATGSARAWRVIWSTLVVAGLLGTLVLAVEFGPADRKNAFSEPRESAAIALVAGLAAGLFLVVVALMPVPDARSGAVGGLGAVLIALITAGILVYRLVVGASDRRGFTGEDLRWWSPMAAVVVLLLIVVAVRCDLARRRGRPAPVARSSATRSDAVLRELRRTAERLAATKLTVEVQQDWQKRLERLAEKGWPEATIAQAKAMTPAAWLAWLSYDGEIEIRSVLPRG
ncbi:hypothetical protein CU254_19215 [Amycolatopsis sp. AA4]|uniref:hypothetical protein n=1 Tax=Actinomycetes TaxID=1760 RepID=UPI0001B5805F|nr:MULTISPECIES: hypothetical protein [Actinomycetes]ATY12359.1 hypothetical protein CU254_19215 [Amycolatopsis sp. AA4]EFL08110.1 predicted protein [Streptomyces sp. AA4]